MPWCWTLLQFHLLRFRLSSSRAAEHIGQQLVASMICLKPCPQPRSMSNEPVPGLLVMRVSMFSLDDLFYVFLQLVSISLRSWNADDRENVGCGLPDEIYALLLCLVVVRIRLFSRLPHCWCDPDKLREVVCVDTVDGIHIHLQFHTGWKICTTTTGERYPQKFGVSKIAITVFPHDFWQLCNLIENISRRQPDVISSKHC